VRAARIPRLYQARRPRPDLLWAAVRPLSAGRAETEQAVRLVGDACGKEQVLGASVIFRAVAELQGPQAVDSEGIPLWIDERAAGITGAGVERVDTPVTPTPVFTLA